MTIKKQCYGRVIFPRPPYQKKPSISKIARFLRNWLLFRKFLTDSIAIIIAACTLILLIIGIYLLPTFDREEIILEAITIPNKLIDSGYTGTVVAEKLLDAAHVIVFDVQKSTTDTLLFNGTNIEKIDIEAHMPDIKLPGTEFTWRSLLRFAPQIFSYKPIYLRGEITKSEKGFQLTLRNITKGIPAVQTPYENDLDLLLHKYGGEAILKISSPRILAIQALFQLTENILNFDPYDESLKKLEEIVNYCLKYDFIEDYSKALVVQGIALTYLDRYDEAIAIYRMAIKLNPKNANVYLGWGDVFARLGRFDEAIEKLQKAIEVDPENSYAHISLGYAYASQNLYNEAMGAFQESNELNHEHSLTYYYWGLSLEIFKNYDEAIEKYQTAIDLNPRNANAYLSWGNVLYKLGRHDEAIEKYEDTIAIVPKKCLMCVYHAWGNILNTLGHYEEAIEKYKEATDLNPRFAHTYYSWGNTLYNLERYENAIEKYKEVIRIDPKYTAAYSNWGNALYKLGRHDEAIEKYEDAIAIVSKIQLMHVYHAWGNILSNLEHYEEAIEKYREVIDLNPRHANAYLDWGNVLYKLKRYNEAIEKYKEIIDLNPRNANAYLGWGNVLYKLKRYNEAIGKYKEVIRIDPKYTAAYYLWGLALEKLEKIKEAEVLFQKARELEMVEDDVDQVNKAK